ncbi:MAG: zinc-ribbon domain-containing protein [Rhodocyclales bacterium]|nr:zinc-ribbon domain-containing protein [Rhodocyclales bacterium]
MLIVRCPACHTVFRVRPEQLRAHGGRVRCGNCHGAFNAVEHLMDQERIADADALAEKPGKTPSVASAPSPTPRPSARLDPGPLDKLDFGIPETRPTAPPTMPPLPRPERSTPAGNVPAHATPAGQTSTWPALEPGSEPSRTEHRPYVPPRPAPPPPDLFAPKGMAATRPPTGHGAPGWSAEPPTEPTPAQEEPITLPVAQEPPSPPAIEPDAPSPFVVRDEDPPPIDPHDPHDPDDGVDDTPAFLYHAEPPSTHRWLWGLMTGMLAGTLAVQAAYLFREDIARKWPQTRPWYLELCVHLGCTVPLPRVASAITIESSNLESDPHDPRQFILSARVRNQAPHPQQYPHLELTLTDGRDRPVVRRVIAPDEWVPGGAEESGISPRAEVEASVPFAATGPVSAVGYRVYAFYP